MGGDMPRNSGLAQRRGIADWRNRARPGGFVLTLSESPRRSAGLVRSRTLLATDEEVPLGHARVFAREGTEMSF